MVSMIDASLLLLNPSCKENNRTLDERRSNFLNPETSVVDINVNIGKDTIIYPGAILEGRTNIGECCTIIGSSRIVDSNIGNNVDSNEPNTRKHSK